jgi:hypothetical protein
VKTKGGLRFEDQSKQSKAKAGNKMIKVIRLPRKERHTHKCNLQSTNFKTFGTKTDSQYSSAQLYNKTLLKLGGFYICILPT